MEKGTQPGRVIVLSGPSGGGKSTVVRKALEPGDLPVHLKVSVTTRQKRKGELDGIHYHFWTPEQFAAAVERNEFIEWAEVHGNRYGTLKSEVEPYLAQGMSVLMELDIEGARQVRRLYPGALLIFLQTSSLDAYEHRLRQRRTEDEATIQTRLAAARRELAAASEYDKHLVNDDLDEAVQAFREVLIHCCGGGRRAG